MTAVFDRHGLKFQYPENWTLTEEIADGEEVVEIQLQSPGGAIWSLTVLNGDASGESLIDEVLESLKTQYEGTESEPASEQVGDFRMEGFDSYFYCLDLLVSNRIRFVEHDGLRLLFMTQAESREFDRQELVFSAITTSLLRSLADSGTTSGKQFESRD